MRLPFLQDADWREFTRLFPEAQQFLTHQNYVRARAYFKDGPAGKPSRAKSSGMSDEEIAGYRALFGVEDDPEGGPGRSIHPLEAACAAICAAIAGIVAVIAWLGAGL